MSNRFKTAINAALESQDEADAIAANTTIIDAAPADAAVGEVVEAAREVDACNDDCAALDEVYTGLEAIAASLESHGALSPQSAHFMYMAANSQLARVGLNMRTAPSLESFESQTRARSATFLSMETIQEQIKALWEAIKKAFLAAKKAVIEFFTKLVSASEQLAKQAEQLAHAASKFSGAPKSDTVDLGPLAHKLAVGGKLDNLMGHFADVSVLIEDMAQYEGASADDFALNAQVTLKVLRAKNADEVASAVNAFAQHDYKAPRAFQVTKTVEDGVEHTTKELPGGIVVGVKVVKPGAHLEGVEKMEALFNGITVVSRQVHSAAEVQTAAKTASLSDIKLIAGGCASIAKEAGQLRDRLNATIAKIESEGEAVAKTVAEQAGEEGGAKIKGLFRALNKGALATMHIPTKISANILTIARAYVGYAHKSLTQYQFEGPKVKEEAAA